nr:hypothetical protein [Tanacetum cinerariifolium]
MAEQQTIKYAPQSNYMTVDNVTFQTNNVVGNFNYPPNVPAYKPIMKFLLNCPLNKAFTNCPLMEFLIKFLVLNGQRTLTLDFNTFCSSTGLDYNNGKYVGHPTPEAVKKELGKIAINSSYLDKTLVLKNSFPVAWRILFTFVIQDEKFRFLPSILINFNFTKDPSKVTEIELTVHIIAVNNQRDSVSPLPLTAKPKKGKSQIVTPTLPKSQGPEAFEALSKKRQKLSLKSHPLRPRPRPEGPLRDKDSGRNKPLADMEPIYLIVADPLGTGAKELDTQPLVLSTYADVKAFLLSDDEAQESKEDILRAGEEMDEDFQTASIVKTYHQSPPPWEDKLQSSHALSTEALNTDSFYDDSLKKYDNTLPLTERQLVIYSRKVSTVLFDRITEDNWEKRKKATINYANLKASIDEYYDENITHRDQTGKLVEATMSFLNNKSTTIRDLYKVLNVITKLLKEINNAIKDDPVIHKKISKATKLFTKIFINITEVLNGLKTTSNPACPLLKKTLSIKTMMNEMYQVFKGQSSGSVTPTLALIHIPANVKGKNATNTATEDSQSHTEGETDANKQEKIRKILEDLGIKSALPAPAHEQTLSKSSRKKRKHMELEPKIKNPGLECNRALPKNVSFVNNMVVEEPKHGIFFTDKFAASMVQSPINARFNMQPKKLIAEHPDQEKLKSKKVKLEALGYEMN